MTDSHQVPAVSTPATPAEIFAGLCRAWQDRFGETPSRASLLVLLAQSALETGRWRHANNWNLGGLKRLPNDGHDWAAYQTTEDFGHGLVHIEQDFRAYDSLDEGLADYLGVMVTRYASAWGAVLDGDPARFVERLKAARYFTGDLETYRSSVVSLFLEYDRTMPALDEAPVTDPSPSSNA